MIQKNVNICEKNIQRYIRILDDDIIFYIFSKTADLQKPTTHSFCRNYMNQKSVQKMNYQNFDNFYFQLNF